MKSEHPLYVYAILDAAAAPEPGWSPLRGVSLSIVRHKAVAAAVAEMAASERAVDELANSQEAVLRHEAVVEALARRGAVLPVRFGTIFSSADAIARVLKERYRVFRADLVRVGGQVEIGVLITWASAAETEEPSAAAPPGDETAGAGTRYLRKRSHDYARDQKDERALNALARELEAALQTHIRASRHQVSSRPKPILRAAYLTSASELAAIRIVLDAFRGRHEHIRLVASGPWPPYSFVTRPNSPGMDPAQRGTERRHRV